ncbi:winged helix-turn-helix transcriptional regulator [uncultured Clostridium sp.]|uniref:winged helix-turn-helix transcriptional regulator n=1 Tax=uncultured Clostridium sp. TaxID=59620 RepID=UPI0028EAA195|nr:winged helix-turn-helix transcriptional regulator [uncultured Clostridium sp.]
MKDGSKRFSEILRHLDNKCSKKVLIQQLDLLQETNIIKNQKNAIGNTIGSYYFLTDEGIKLLPTIEQMISWGDRNLTCG